jgi:hypothetical protein
MTIKTYDPRQVSIVIANHAIQGLSAETSVVIEREDVAYKHYLDSRGNGNRFRVQNDYAKITLNINQCSESNNLLSAYQEFDREKGAGAFTLMIRDYNTEKTLITSTAAWIEKNATIELASENKIVEWTIISSETDQYITGTSMRNAVNQLA